MKKIIHLVLLTGLFMPAVTFAGGSSLYGGSHRYAQINREWSVQPLFSYTDVEGFFRVSENKNPASSQRINLKRDTVNLDKENSFGINCSYKSCNRGIIETNIIKHEHNGNLGIGRRFRGRDFIANSKYNIDSHIYDILFNYHLWHKIYNSGIEKYYVSGLFGVKVINREFAIRGQTQAPGGEQYLKYSEAVTTPYIGLEYGTFLGKYFYFKTGLRYCGTEIDKYDTNHYDYNTSLSYRISGDDCSHDVLLDIGYRYIEHNTKNKDKANDIELTYKGPYFGFDLLF